MKSANMFSVITAFLATTVTACAQPSEGVLPSGPAPAPPPLGAAPPPPPPGGPLTASGVPGAPPAPLGAVNAVTITGTIKSYLFNPGGQQDGLILVDGKQLHFPPHLSAMMLNVVQPGDKIQAAVEPGVQSQFGQEYRTISLTNTKTGATIVDQPPLAPPAPPAPPAAGQPITSKSSVVSFLVGHMGAVNGLILADGSQVHFPPTVGAAVTGRVKIGDRIGVQGYGTQTAAAKSFDATNLNVNGADIPMGIVAPQ